MTRRKRSVMEMGFDSFLDIVANLVGILIILVVVLGSRSREVAEAAAVESLNNSEEIAELRNAAVLADAARRDVTRLRQQASVYELEMQSRRKERSVLLDLLNAAREQWSEKKKELTSDQQDAARLAAELALQEKELRDLTGERTRLQGAEDPVIAIEHLPSPMAKTVFGEEIHMRIQGGFLSVVPIDSLVDAIREEFRRGVNGTRPGTSQSTVGPIRGWIAKYEMERSQTVTSRGGSVGPVVRMEMTGMTIVPTEEPMGTPLANVLDAANRGERSLLDIELAGRDPATTTVTVWVYPDSYREFRSLKEYLYAKGIATAARPLPTGQPISGGPQGSRSASQ
jgi:alkylhydroperoxidase family enzyme